MAFSGRTWRIKASSVPVGPGPNVFSDAPGNVWVDDIGRLHLRITQRGGSWLAAEVVLDDSLGYGRYRFSLDSRVDRFDAGVVVGLFTWSDASDLNHREIDIEFGRWADAPGRNGRYTVAPANQPGHGHAFDHGKAAATVHEFRWSATEVSFRSATTFGMTIDRWSYRGADIPSPGDEHTRINLWLQGGVPPSDGEEVELVLSSFSFAPPAPGPAPPSDGALA